MVSRLALLGVSGPGGSAPAPPAGFVPTDIYGVEAWYYQPNIDYAAGTWTDRSGNVRDLVQGTAGNRPTLSAALAELNGKYGLGFDGTNDYIKAAAFTLNQPITVLGIGRQRGWTTNDNPLDGNADFSMALFQATASPRMTMYAGSNGPSAATAWPIGKFSIVVPQYNGASSLFYIDGAAIGPTNVGAANAGGLTLGATGTGTSPANVEWSELIVLRSKVGAYDLTRLWNEWFTADRYNIPVTFDPLTLSPAAWFKSDAGVYSDAGVTPAVDGATVQQWNDQSGNGRHLSQATAGARPVYRSKDRNGLPTIKLDGSANFMQSAAWAQAQPITMYLVYRLNTWNGSAPLIDLGSATGPAQMMLSPHTSTPTIGLFAGSWADQNISAALGSWNIQVAVFNGVTSNGYIDGVASSVINPGTNPAAKITLGQWTDLSAQFSHSDWQEILIFSGTHTAAQRQQMEGYLANRHAINAAIRPFDPLSVAGCKGWWRVDGGCDVSADAALIGTIYDRSGNGNHLVQATATNKPSYETAELNTYAVARFDGVDNFITGALTAIAQPLTFIGVMKQNAWTADGIPLSLGTAGGDAALWQRTTTPNLGMYAGTAYTPARTDMPTGSWGLINLVFNGASSEFTLDGIGSVAGNPGSAGANRVALGGFSAASNLASCEWAEWFIYSGALADADQRSLEAYLAKRYDIAYKAPNHSSLLANLAAWYDASQIVGLTDGAAIATWPDMSGNGRDAVQAVAGNRPTYQTLEQNGRPAVRVDITDDWLDNPYVLNAVQTVFVVGKATPTSGYHTFLSTGGLRVYSNANGANWGIEINGGGGTFSAGQTVNTHKILSVVASAFNNIKLFTNGANLVTVTGGTGWLGDVELSIGSLSNGTTFLLDGDILQIVIFNVALSDADRRAVENYLAQQLNIAV